MAIAILTTAACGRLTTALSDAKLTPSELADAHTPDFQEKPCSLLDPKEVEAAIGSPLAGPPYLDTANPGTCHYDTPDFHRITITVQRKGAARHMEARVGLTAKMTAKAGMDGDMPKGILPEEVNLKGEWDRLKVTGCCEYWALKGDSGIMLNAESFGKTIRPQHALTLINQAIRRLDHPLSIDGRAGIAAARAHQKLRPQPRPACDLIPHAEVERIVEGRLSQPPTSNEDGTACEYAYQVGKSGTDSAPPPPRKITITVVAWSGGFAKYFGEPVILLPSSVNALHATTDPGDGPWDGARIETVTSSVYLTGVRKDVLIKIETQDSPVEVGKRIERDLAVKAFEKL